MSYWRNVLAEVLNKKDLTQPVAFTNVREYTKLPECRVKSAPGKISEELKNTYDKIAKTHTQINGEPKKYWLGEKFPHVYFTKREAQIMSYLLSGLNTTQVAEKLELSRRTIEFYINNMKAKIKCRFRSDLVSEVQASDFSQRIDFELKM